MPILDGKYVNKEASNGQDKVASHFVGYRPSPGYNGHSASSGLIVGIILRVLSETAGWVFQLMFFMQQ